LFHAVFCLIFTFANQTFVLYETNTAFDKKCETDREARMDDCHKIATTVVVITTK
jgi:hypothetical protein